MKNSVIKGKFKNHKKIWIRLMAIFGALLMLGSFILSLIF